MNKKHTIETLSIISRIAVAAVLLTLALANYDKLVNLDIRSLLENVSGVWVGAAIIIGVYALKSVLFVIPAILIYISVGLSFDIQTALLINLAGISAEITITYFLGKFLGGETVKKLLMKSKGGQKLLTMKKKNEIAFLFTVRVLPVFPIDFTSLFLGASGYAFLPCFLISLLGIYPRVALFTILGEGIYTYFSKELLMKLVIILIPAATAAYLISFIIKKKKAKHAPDMSLHTE